MEFDRPGAHGYLACPTVLGAAAPALTSMPALPIAYVIGPNGKAVYTQADLDAYAAKVKERAVRRMGGRRSLPSHTSASASAPAALAALAPFTGDAA